MFAQEGVSAFWKGITPRVARVAPGTSAGLRCTANARRPGRCLHHLREGQGHDHERTSPHALAAHSADGGQNRRAEAHRRRDQVIGVFCIAPTLAHATCLTPLRRLPNLTHAPKIPHSCTLALRSSARNAAARHVTPTPSQRTGRTGARSVTLSPRRIKSCISCRHE